MEGTNAKAKGLATASFILGLFFWFWLFNIFTSPLAILLGIRSLTIMRRNEKEYSKKHFIMAVLGVVMGLITTVFLLMSLAISITKTG